MHAVLEAGARVAEQRGARGQQLQSQLTALAPCPCHCQVPPALNVAANAVAAGSMSNMVNSEKLTGICCVRNPAFAIFFLWRQAAKSTWLCVCVCV